MWMDWAAGDGAQLGELLGEALPLRGVLPYAHHDGTNDGEGKNSPGENRKAHPLLSV